MSGRALHVWTILCKRSEVESDAGRLTLIEPMEQLNVGRVSIPEGATGTFVPLRAEIISLWSRESLDEPARAEARVRLFNPQRRPIGKIQLSVDLTETPREHQRKRFNMLPFEGPGLYWFEVEVQEGGEWRGVARVPLEVTGG